MDLSWWIPDTSSVYQCINYWTVICSKWKCFPQKTEAELRWGIKNPFALPERVIGFTSFPLSFYFFHCYWSHGTSDFHTLLQTALTIRYSVMRKQEILSYHQSNPHVDKKWTLSPKKDPVTNVKVAPTELSGELLWHGGNFLWYLSTDSIFSMRRCIVAFPQWSCRNGEIIWRLLCRF